MLAKPNTVRDLLGRSFLKITWGIVKDLAQRFSDGRLSTAKLMQANDDDLSKMLVEVRGIGRVSPFLSNQ